MSDTTTEHPPEELAKWAAEAEAARASAAKALAEAAMHEATARRTVAEAMQAEHAAAASEAALARAFEEEASRKAGDDHHRFYLFDSEVGPKSVTSCMNSLRRWHRVDPTCDIEIVFNSPGGDIIDGFALFDQILQLRKAGHKVTTGVLGEAASMAGVLVQAGEYRWAGSQSWYLIHRAAFGVGGKTFTVEDQVKFVKRIEKRIIGIFVERSSLTADEIEANWERQDWWLDADEMLTAGLVDEVRGAAL